jgi:cytochrome c-type biogenesis protein CcmH
MRALLCAWALAAALGAFAQSAEVAKPDAATERRLKSLADELRCLVCQNQTISESSAPLAQDLRNQIRSQIAQGRSDTQIRDYMVERYGDFVLYRPPFKATTAILWAGPFALLAVGIALFVRITRRRGGMDAPPAADNDPAGRSEIEALLANQDEKGKS